MHGSFSLMSLLILDFSNIVPKSIIKQLAESDDQEVVREVQVCDFYNI